MLLRIEDIDGTRVKRGAAEAATRDLAWLGLDWDGPPILQSERAAEHRRAAERLMAAGRAYPCVCTRREIDEAASAPHEAAPSGPAYAGTCRGRFASVAAARDTSGRAPALRYRVDVCTVPFEDRVAGRQEGRIAGDFVVMKKDGGAAYQLAVVVDDALDGVTDVLRADDLLPSTPRQLLLHGALGLTPPRFAHVPLVVGEDGLRLAKRHGDTSLARYRTAGVEPERLVGYLAWLAGLCPRATSCRAADLVADFDLGRIRPGPVVVRESDLL